MIVKEVHATFLVLKKLFKTTRTQPDFQQKGSLEKEEAAINLITYKTKFTVTRESDVKPLRKALVKHKNVKA